MAEPAAGRADPRRAADVRLGRSWVVRWDPTAEARPRVLHVPAPRGEAGLWRTPSGGFVVFDGYLFERDPGDDGRPASDAALVASRHRRFGEQVFERLRGGFAVAIWDEERRQLSAGRDALGLHPCFYWWSGRVLLVAASIDAILARAEVRVAFDRTVIAEYLQNQTASGPADETFYERVRRLPPAHSLRLRGGRLDVSRYWDPVPPGFAWASPGEIARFEPLLERAVARCVAAGGDSLALSGGFDSVGIAALAAQAPGNGRPLHAVSLRFSGTVCDEGPTQTAVARALGMPQLLRTLDEALGGHGLITAALGLSPASPSPVMSPWQSAYTGLLRSASGLGLQRLLMGTGGDDLLNLDPTYAADRLAAGDLGALWRFCRACQRTSPFSASRVARGVVWDYALAPELARLGRRALGRLSPAALAWARRRRRARALPTWASPTDGDLASSLARRRDSAGTVLLAPGERAYVGTLRRLTQSGLLLLERDQSHAWARHLGFTFLFPYFDRDLVELSLRIPPEELIAGGRHKAPLRRLVAVRLPMVGLPSKKVDFTQAVHDVLRPAARSIWQSSGGGVMLRELGLVDGGRLDRFMGAYFAGHTGRWFSAWVALSTEAWLRARAGMSFTSAEQEAAA